MSLPTIGTGFSPSTPSADAGFQNAIPRGDNGSPLEKFSFEVPNTGIAAVKTANYTAVAGDCGKLLSFEDSSPVSAHTLTLPSAAPFAQWVVKVQNIGTAVLTISRNGLLIDGAATNLTLAQNCGMDIFTDGVNYFTERGAAALPSGPANEVLATPDGSSGPVAVRALVANDIPSLPESKITNLTADLAAKASIAGVQQEAYVYAADTGAANAYAVTLSPAPTIVAGSEVVFLAAHACTGASTLAVNGGSPIAIKKAVSTALATGDILVGQIVTVKFDGTNWQLGGSSSGGGGTTFGTDLATIDATHQKVLGLNTTPLDTTVSLTDGMTWQYNATSGKWVPVFDRATRPVSAVVGKPGAAQLVLIYTVEATETFPANFTAPQSYGSVGTNPTATAVYIVFKNATNVGTVTISTSGVFTFATTSGAAFTLNAGDRLTMVAPGSQDATLSDVGITLVGTRGSVSASISAPPPVITWRGAYSGSTAYNLYDEVSYLGSSYICIAATTGNLPTNASFWNLVASAGTNGTNGTNGQILIVDAQNETYTYAVDTGSANTYAIALFTAPGSYVAGLTVEFKIATANTGASTLNVNGLGAKNLTKNGTVALALGDLTVGKVVTAVYDGTQFQLQGVGGSSGGIVGVPTTIPGLDFWCDASQLTGFSSGNAVNSWENLIGGPAVSANGTSPTYQAGVINSLPVVRFAGAGNFSSVMPNVVLAREMSFFCVLKISSLSQAYSAVFSSNQASAIQYFIKSNGKTAFYTAGANYDGTGAATLTTSNFYVISVVNGPIGMATRVALAADASSSSTGFQSTGTTSLLGTIGNDPNNSPRAFSGDIAEIIIYKRGLSTSEVSTIENYLKTKYGL